MFRGKNYLTKDQTTKTLFVDCDLYLDTLEKLPFTSEEELEEAGYKEFYYWDNSYNYEDLRELSYTMQWDLWIRKNPKGRGYNYAVVIRKHNGWDVRGNYSLKGIYKTNENCYNYLVWLCDAYHMTSWHKQEQTKKDILQFKQEEL